MAATLTFQGVQQDGTVFDLGGSGSSINLTQNPDWTQPVAGNEIPVGQNSLDRYGRMKITGTFNNVTNFKIWRSDANSLSTGVAISCGGLSDGLGVTFATPSTSTNGDAAIPTVEPGASNLSVDSTGTTRYAPALQSGVNRFLRFQVRSTAATPAGNMSAGTPHALVTVKYDES